MRATAITVLVIAMLAAWSPAAVAQESVSRAAGGVPSPLFEPPPDGLPAGAPVDEASAGAPIAVAVALLAVALVGGYYAGSSNRTWRS